MLIRDDLLSVIVTASYYFLISICLLFCWSLGLRSGIIGLFKHPCVWFRFYLALAIIFTVCCSVLFGFGMSFYSGRQFNYVCTLVPFLLLGIGVNNMMIMVDTFVHSKIHFPSNLSDEERFKLSLTQSAHSITLTFVSCMVAFLIGFTPKIPAVDSFCSFTCWCFIGQYFFQFFIFAPLSVYDYRRCMSHRNCLLFCIKHETDADKKRRQEYQRNNR